MNASIVAGHQGMSSITFGSANGICGTSCMGEAEMKI